MQLSKFASKSKILHLNFFFQDVTKLLFEHDLYLFMMVKNISSCVELKQQKQQQNVTRLYFI